MAGFRFISDVSEPIGSSRRSRERIILYLRITPNKKAFNPAFAGWTLSWYSRKRKFGLYYKSIERRVHGVQIFNKRPVASGAFVILNPSV